MIPRLSIELIPAGSWGNSLCLKLKKEQWDRLRRAAYKKAGYHCEICGGRGSAHPVECHEIWQYDDWKHIQKLVRLIALCPACHEVKHYGRACVMGNEARAFLHLQKVNQWSAGKSQRYVNLAFDVWQSRSCYDWKIDLSILKSLP